MILDSLRAAGGMILGLRAFFRLRDSDEEKQELIDQILQRGFSDPVDVYLWDTVECLFMPDRIVFMENNRRASGRPRR